MVAVANRQDATLCREGSRRVESDKVALRDTHNFTFSFSLPTHSMQVKDQFNCGKFLVTLSADLSDEQVAALLPFSLRYGGQRNTKVDRILGGFETVDGKEKRRADYKRSDVDYSDELAQSLGESFSVLLFPTDETDAEGKKVFIKVPVAVDIAEYTGGGSAEPKYKKQKDAVTFYLAANGGKLKSGEDRTVASFCATRGLTAPEGDWKEDATFLEAVKAWQKATETAE